MHTYRFGRDYHRACTIHIRFTKLECDRKGVTRERNPLLTITTMKRLNIILRIFPKDSSNRKHIRTDFIDFKVIYSMHFESLFLFEYQLNARTISDSTTTLLRHVLT